VTSSITGEGVILIGIVSLAVIVVVHEMYQRALSFVQALPAYTVIVINDMRVWLASKIIGPAYEVVEAGGLAQATAVILPEPTHFADVLRMIKSLGLTMHSEPNGVTFSKNEVSVFGVDDTGEYYLFNAKKDKWTKSTDVRVLTKLRDMVIYHKAPVKVVNVVSGSSDPYADNNY
jgi:hypothetical protein